MEFWGVEVKAGEPLKVALNEGRALHLSQACLGEVKKDKGHESVCLFVNVNGKKFVLGTLFSEKLPQQIFDLVFDKEFELSHNWRNGSVFFYGYTADNNPDESDNEDDSESESESEEDIPLLVPNGAPASQVKQEKPAVVANSKAGKDSAAAEKQKVKIVEPDEKSEDDEDSSDEDDSMSEDDSEDDKDNKSASDEDDDSDEEETPVQKVKSGKKRASESASKTPVPDKKAKLITPKKTDGKKSNVHVATPHPSKQTGKTPANKPNQQIPKTEGSHSCKPCNRTFKTEMALESHNKAKHSG